MNRNKLHIPSIFRRHIKTYNEGIHNELGNKVTQAFSVDNIQPPLNSNNPNSDCSVDVEQAVLWITKLELGKHTDDETDTGMFCFDSSKQK